MQPGMAAPTCERTQGAFSDKAEVRVTPESEKHFPGAAWTVVGRTGEALSRSHKGAMKTVCAMALFSREPGTTQRTVKVHLTPDPEMCDSKPSGHRKPRGVVNRA